MIGARAQGPRACGGNLGGRAGLGTAHRCCSGGGCQGALYRVAPMRALDSSICRPIRVHAWFWNGAQGVDALVRELGARRAELEQVLKYFRSSVRRPSKTEPTHARGWSFPYVSCLRAARCCVDQVGQAYARI